MSIVQRITGLFRRSERTKSEVVSAMQRHAEIDRVAFDPKSQTVQLVMIETREWHDHDRMLYDFQEKLNTYIGYVESGKLARDFPDLKGKTVTFRLFASHPIPSEVRGTLKSWKDQFLTPRRIEWIVTIAPQG
jgi:hypothetical protein